jgi:hypothetical protein
VRKSSNPGNTAEPLAGRQLEEALTGALTDALRARLPQRWRASTVRPGKAGKGRPGGVIEIVAPDGRIARLLLEVKSRVEPKDVPSAVVQSRRYGQALPGTGATGVVVGSTYLSPRARELLAAEGAGYVDLTGNVRVAVDDPPLFLEMPGSDANPWAEERTLRSLRGAASSRVVRALCDFRPPYGIQALAERSRTPIATVSRVVSFLDGEALVIREYRGAVTDVRWVELIRRWTQDYSFSESNCVAPYLGARGLPALLDRLPALTCRYAVTGSLAVTDLAPVAAPRLAAVFVDAPPDEAAAALGLRPAETGANVLLASPYDPVVFERTRRQGAQGMLVCAAPSQVAADLLTGPGRSPAEGEALLEWMREHEDAWRA